MNEVIVTGGAGFVGSHLVDSLVKEGIKITVIDNFSNGVMENIKQHEEKIKIIKFDIVNRDWSILDDINPDTIFHLATHPRSFSLQDPIRDAEVNVQGILNVLEFAKEKK